MPKRAIAIIPAITKLDTDNTLGSSGESFAATLPRARLRNSTNSAMPGIKNKKIFGTNLASPQGSE
jgi:hypothetical protein